jgi:hypothetical protein
MNEINQLLGALKGKRTYLALIAAGIYFGGAQMGQWKLDEELAGLIGTAALLFLRAAIGQKPGSGNSADAGGAASLPGAAKSLMLSLLPALLGGLCLVVLFLAAGCAQGNGDGASVLRIAPAGGTNSSGEVVRDTAGNILETTAFGAALRDLRRNPKPENRAKWEDIWVRLETAEGGDGELFGTLFAELQGMTGKDAQDAMLIGWLLYELELKQHAPEVQLDFTGAIASRLRAGIGRALTLTKGTSVPATTPSAWSNLLSIKNQKPKERDKHERSSKSKIQSRRHQTA